ncbi:nuclear transport factor 2 family protein [candidate division KSB1 bacterium]|nr:nuclear transport factor 2 family protein [bacterium]NUM64459.1 nuclear transport factor 2 family protein [candidate division KSB1 bacterium]
MPENNNPNEIQILKALSAAWDQTLASNDAEAIDRFMADDWAIVSEHGAMTKEKFLAMVASGDLTHETFKGEIISVRQYGEVAVLSGRVKNNGHYKSQPFSSDEWTTDVFVKRNGTWLCVHSHITAVKPA